MLDYKLVSTYLRHEQGVLYWIKNKCTAKAGNVAGGFDRYGYLRVNIGGKSQRVHRVVWLLHTGTWPDKDIDHLDRDKSNNDPSNLRLCTDSQNQANTTSKRKGFKGVTLHKCGKYQAQHRRKYLGLFETEMLAAKAYDEAARNTFGAFARCNFQGEAA